MLKVVLTLTLVAVSCAVKVDTSVPTTSRAMREASDILVSTDLDSPKGLLTAIQGLANIASRSKSNEAPHGSSNDFRTDNAGRADQAVTSRIHDQEHQHFTSTERRELRNMISNLINKLSHTIKARRLTVIDEVGRTYDDFIQKLRFYTNDVEDTNEAGTKENIVEGSQKETENSAKETTEGAEKEVVTTGDGLAAMKRARRVHQDKLGDAVRRRVQVARNLAALRVLRGRINQLFDGPGAEFSGWIKGSAGEDASCFTVGTPTDTGFTIPAFPVHEGNDVRVNRVMLVLNPYRSVPTLDDAIAAYHDGVVDEDSTKTSNTEAGHIEHTDTATKPFQDEADATKRRDTGIMDCVSDRDTYHQRHNMLNKCWDEESRDPNQSDGSKRYACPNLERVFRGTDGVAKAKHTTWHFPAGGDSFRFWGCSNDLAEVQVVLKRKAAATESFVTFAPDSEAWTETAVNVWPYAGFGGPADGKSEYYIPDEQIHIEASSCRSTWPCPYAKLCSDTGEVCTDDAGCTAPAVCVPTSPTFLAAAEHIGSDVLIDNHAAPHLSLIAQSNETAVPASSQRDASHCDWCGTSSPCSWDSSKQCNMRKAPFYSSAAYLDIPVGKDLTGSLVSATDSFRLEYLPASGQPLTESDPNYFGAAASHKICADVYFHVSNTLSEAGEGNDARATNDKEDNPQVNGGADGTSRVGNANTAATAASTNSTG